MSSAEETAATDIVEIREHPEITIVTTYEGNDDPVTNGDYGPEDAIDVNHDHSNGNEESSDIHGQQSEDMDAEIQPMEEMASTEDDEYAKLLKKRMQPIYELVDSERTYVNSLKIIAERYIPLSQEPLPGLDMPDDLASKWRIIWGNWIQLFEWHQNFLERLENLLKEDQTEKIPKLFIDSKTRLRSYYSKYCENHRKAAIIAEQYRDFFEEVRIRVGDKQDVVSHLMKPVQRIMRYQLPMEGIVKCTERAGLPSLSLWVRALDIMKEIPGDTQLILEAARIDGYPGTITALGKVRILDDLRVATMTFAELQSLRNVNSVSSDGLSSSLLSGGSHSISGMGSGNEFANTSPSDLAMSNENTLLKFQDRRLFLFDQSLLVTEEVKPKKNNPYAQSTYQFKSAVNVNKMKFDSHWRSGSAFDDEDELKFVIYDKSPGKELVYIIDPGTISQREAWVVQLRDIQTMQQELLLALQDPKRFAERGARRDGTDHLSPTSFPTPDNKSAKTSTPASQQSSDSARGKGAHSRVKSDVSEKRKGMSFIGDTKLRLPFSRKNESKKPAAAKAGRSGEPLSRKESCPEVAVDAAGEDNGSPMSQSEDVAAANASIGSSLLNANDEENVSIRSGNGQNVALKFHSWSGISFRIGKRELRKVTSTLPSSAVATDPKCHQPNSGDSTSLTTPTGPPSHLHHSSSSKKKSGSSIFSIFGKSHKHKTHSPVQSPNEG